MSEYVIGVDIGTQSTKALLTDARGRIVAQHSAGYRPDTPRPLWAEQWPAVWLDAVQTSIAACVAHAKTADLHAYSDFADDQFVRNSLIAFLIEPAWALRLGQAQQPVAGTQSLDPLLTREPQLMLAKQAVSAPQFQQR